MTVWVVALCGLPGSGKSTLARALGDALRWARLDRDAVRREVFADGGYTPQDKTQLGALMRARMSALLLQGHSVILDGMTFARAGERAAFAHDAQRAGARWLLVHVDGAIALAQARVAADRGHPAVDRNVALVADVAARFETPEDALRIDALLSTAEQLCVLLRALNRKEA